MTATRRGVDDEDALTAFTALANLDLTATLTTSALLGTDNQTLYLI